MEFPIYLSPEDMRINIFTILDKYFPLKMNIFHIGSVFIPYGKKTIFKGKYLAASDKFFENFTGVEFFLYGNFFFGIGISKC
jgi:hypothetical protein